MDSAQREVEYRSVYGFPMYRVGSDGSVWSIWSGIWRRMATPPDKDGYPKILLYVGVKNGGKKRHANVHILVLEHFASPCPPGMEACHNDGIVTNCAIGNLRWGTHQENINDKNTHKTVAVGSRHGMAKLTESDIPVIRGMFRRGDKILDIAEKFGIGRTSIDGIIKNKLWRHVPDDHPATDAENT